MPPQPDDVSKRPEIRKDRSVGTGSAGSQEDAGEIGGPSGLEPTRYGDWEKHGRCIDF